MQLTEHKDLQKSMKFCREIKAEIHSILYMKKMLLNHGKLQLEYHIMLYNRSLRHMTDIQQIRLKHIKTKVLLIKKS